LVGSIVKPYYISFRRAMSTSMPKIVLLLWHKRSVDIGVLMESIDESIVGLFQCVPRTLLRRVGAQKQLISDVVLKSS
jgi:hypothetical protein